MDEKNAQLSSSRPLPSPAHDVFRRQARPLHHLFQPKTVALIGASETPGSVGRTLFTNLLASDFGGTVVPINPRRPSILGHAAFPSVAAVPGTIDLAVVATPAAAVPGVISACAERGVPAAIVISAGFREVGPAGVELERATREAARRGGMRVVGPNCLGVMSPATGLNATFARGMARPGSVAFLSQSGALITAVLDWSRREEVGFSALVSVGAMMDVGWGDLIDHFGDDPATAAIVMYMESIGDARAFLSAAREVALVKPIIVIKAGRGEAARRAAASHTGALTGSDAALDAAFRRAGVLRVDSIEEVFDLAELLAKQPRPAGPRLTIVTNAGGPGVLATDALVAAGGQLASLSGATLSRLNALLPEAWSHANPIDVLGDARPERLAEAVAIAAADAGSDGVLAVLTPQDMTEPTRAAELLCAASRVQGKPILASWMGGPDVAEGIAVLNRAGIPTFAFPDGAARAFCHMWRYAENLQQLYETPQPGSGPDARPQVEPAPARAHAQAVLERALAEGRTLLDESEAKAVLAAHGIPTVPTQVAADEDEAVRAAQAIGFPVAVKVWSRTVTHKADVGGVRLGLGDGAAVARAFREIRDSVRAKVGAVAGAQAFLGVSVQPMIDRSAGYELILGASVDAQLGPVMLFGAGGTLVEVLQDRALALPPLTETQAHRLIDQTRVARALAGVRGQPPVAREALDAVLVRFAELLLQQPGIAEIDINPLLATPTGVVALDARIVLADPARPAESSPRAAIRPYPANYVWDVTTRDGETLRIRPIRPDDEALIVQFHGQLGEETVRQRYGHAATMDARTAHARLLRICFADYDRELPLVAEHREPTSGERTIVAVGRLSRDRGLPREAELSLVIADRWQGRGVGRLLMDRLLESGRREGLIRIRVDILRRNLRMQRLCAAVGFVFDPAHDVKGEVVSAVFTT